MARATDKKAKEKKQKIMLAVLGVVLLGVLAFELPTLLKSGSSAAPPVTPATTTTGATLPSSPPASGTAASASTATDPELVFSPAVDKLSKLNGFQLKDPFDSHGVTATADSAATATSAPAAAKAALAAAGPGSAAGKAGPVFGTVQGPSGGASTKSLPAVTLRVNGRVIKVALGAKFPAANPFFRLAGVRPGGLIVSLVKGSLADGSTFLELEKRKPLTLVNTTDGGRFTIEFLSQAKAKAA